MKHIVIVVLLLNLVSSSVAAAGDYNHVVPFKLINPNSVQTVFIYQWLYEGSDNKLGHWSIVWDSRDSDFISEQCRVCMVLIYFYHLDWFEFFAIQGLDKSGRQIYWDEITHIREPK